MQILLNDYINMLTTNRSSRGITKLNLILNFGPQHPAAHGVLRLIVVLRGEYVSSIDPHIGFLHRGSECLMEQHSLLNNIVFLDRLDYTSVLTQTHAYCLSIESMCNSLVDITTLGLRTLLDELSRLLNHLLSLATHALDVGTMAIIFWAFEDRERIMELVEYISGARMHACLYTPLQSLQSIVTQEFIAKVLILISNFNKTFTEIYISLYNNRVWRLRLVGIGCVTANNILSLGISGVIARSGGVLYDVRLYAMYGYGLYNCINIRYYLGIYGDSYDRFLIRVRELFESSRIILQVVTEYFTYNRITLLNSSRYTYNTKVEYMINLFRRVECNIDLIEYVGCGSVESGKGLFQVTLITNNSNKPYRIYIRSPAYMHLQLLPMLCSGLQLADIATLLGTLDIVFGEVDR